MRLARVSAWPGFSITFAIPFAVGAVTATSWPKALIGFSAMLLFAGFAFALNFYSDRDTDSYHDGVQKDFNLRQQPMVTGEISVKEFKIFSVATLLSSIALGFLVSNLFGALVILACLAGGVLYSHPRIRLKAKPVGDILCIASLGLLAPSSGYVLGAGELPTALMMLFWFFVTATGYIPTVMSDFEFDVRAGLRTSAVVFGQSGLLKAMAVGSLLCLVLSVFVFRSDFYPEGTKGFSVFAVTVLVVFTAVVWRSLKPPKLHMPLISSSRPWVFVAVGIALPGIITLLFLAYGFLKIYSPESVSWDPFLTF
ncbi:MAG: UbiA family prenyltransferase [Dehalococcoidia bacterium]